MNSLNYRGRNRTRKNRIASGALLGLFLLITIPAAVAGYLQDLPELDKPMESAFVTDTFVTDTAGAEYDGKADELLRTLPSFPATGLSATGADIQRAVTTETVRLLYIAPAPAAEPQPITAADWYGVAPEDLSDRLQGLYIPSVYEVDKTAKMMPREYNGPSITERALPVWCVCDRIDAGGWDFENIRTVDQAITHDYFEGYYPSNPVLPEYRDLAIDVYTRWLNEKLGFEDVGRVLPAEYTFFSGTGTHNIYRTIYHSRDPECVFYDGGLPSPYES